MKTLLSICLLSLACGLAVPQAQHARQAAIEASGLAAAMVAEDPQAFTGEVDFDRLQQVMEPWYVRIERELAEIPQPEIRERILQAYDAWLEQTHPFETLLAKVLQQDKAITRYDIDSQNLLFRRDPAIDGRLLSLEADEQKRQAMLAIRAAYLFQRGEQDRAEGLWRKVEDDAIFFASLHSSSGGILLGRDTDWTKLFNLAAEREHSAWRHFIYGVLADKSIQVVPLEVMAYIQGAGCPILQQRMLRAILTKASDPELVAAASEALANLPEQRRRELQYFVYKALAQQDPALAWKAACEKGLDTKEGKARAKAVITYVANSNPRAAVPWLLEAVMQQKAQDLRLLDRLGQGLTDEDPQLAFAFALALPPSGTRTNLMQRALTVWSARDPDAACHAVLAMEPTPMRAQALEIALRKWLSEERDRAAEWIQTQTEGADRELCLRILATVRNELEPQAWEALYFEVLPDDVQGNIADSIAREWSKWDFREAFRFLRAVEARRPEISVWNQWQRVLEHWQRLDPEAADAWQASADWQPENRTPMSSSQWLRLWQQTNGMGRRQPAKDRPALLRTALQLPSETQVELLAGLLKDEADFPALADAVLAGAAGRSPLLGDLAQLIDLLEQGQSEALLAAALKLPAPDFDWLVCRILDGYGSRQQAQAAVDALAQTVPGFMRERAAALLTAVWAARCTNDSQKK